MSEVRTIHIQALDGSLHTLTVEVTIVAPWKLTVSGAGFQGRVFEREDLFDALVELRGELEKAGHRLLCGGARVDAYPSGMSRSMGGGRKVYITQLGKSATDMIDIFDEAKPEAIGTVEQQKEFHSKWIRSLTKSKLAP